MQREPSTVVRLLGRGRSVAAVAETPFGCLAMRVSPLQALVPGAESLDVVLEARRLDQALAGAGAHDAVSLPTPLPPTTFASSMPPTGGWEALEVLPAAAVAGRVAAAVGEFRHRSTGDPAFSDRVAAEVWATSLAGDVPVRLAHAAQSLGLLGGDPVRLSRVGRWRRLDGAYGTTLTRVGERLGLLTLG